MAQRLPSTYRTLCYKELSVPPKIRILPSGTLSQTSDLENCATASRSRCQQNSSSSSSTVEFVGDTNTTIDESWLFTTTYKSVNCNPLTPFDLLRICRATCNMVGRPCVGLCLCPSVTNRSSTETAKRRITKQHRAIAQGVQFSDAEDLRELRSGSPPRSTGAPNAGVVGQNRRLSTNNWLYLENGTR